MFVTTKQVFCHDKSMLVITNTCLSWQSFVATKIFCRNKHSFVVTNVLSRQACFCCNKRHVLSWQQLCLWQLPPIIDITILVDANTNLLPYWLMQTPTYCLTGWCKHQLTGLPNSKTISITGGQYTTSSVSTSWYFSPWTYSCSRTWLYQAKVKLSGNINYSATASGILQSLSIFL